MTPALIDVHVRAAPGGDASDWPQLAQAAGLDGLLVVALDLPPQHQPGQRDGVQFFCGVELDTDVGRLICIPAEDDVWFRGAGWRALHRDDRGYLAAEVAREFAERGGAVILAQPFDRDLDHLACEDAFVAIPGLVDSLAGVVVASASRHAASNERAVSAARRARLRALGGSAAEPGQERFGGVATLFAEGPEDQAGLVAALRGGRTWTVELESPLTLGGADDDDGDDDDNDGDEAGESGGVAPVASGNVARPSQAQAKARPTKPEPPAKVKRAEREDNRGNRLDIALFRRQQSPALADRQPDMDPIARVYGLADRAPEVRFNHLSDDELDRMNGNRARGSDPNMMAPLDFREMRAERAHVNLLLEAIEDRRETADNSLALRFALLAFEQAQGGADGAGRSRDGGPSGRSGGHRGGHGGHGGQGFQGSQGGHGGGHGSYPAGHDSDPRRKRRRRKG